MRQKKRAAAVLLSAVMAFSAVSPAVPVWAASWQKNASGSYIGSDGSVLTGILSRGIDVSQWQQNINWSAVADDDIQFAMIGTRYNNAVDPYFDTNVRGAAAAGLRVGVYLYSYATTTAMAESDADFVLNLIKDYPISYPVVLDVEAQEMNSLTPAQVSDIINAFCKKVETAGYYPMVYTNDYWISNKIDMTKVHYDVWIARYDSKPAYQGAALWQASNQGTVSGISGNVDINFTFKDLSGKLPANRWRLIGDKWYYYKNYVKQTGWINDGQSWYYLNADGTQFKGWLLLDNQYYYLLPTTGQMKTGWLKAEDAWYYLNSDGTMAKNWIQVDGTYYYLLNGAMVTGWLRIGNDYYYMRGNGSMVTGWRKMDGKYYYFNGSGKLVRGWADIDGKRYFLQQDGTMLTGWQTIDGLLYYFDANGAMAASGRVSEALLAQLMRDPYLSRRPPKTTGREHYGAAFVDGIFAAANERKLSDADILATVTDFTAQTIAAAIRDFCAVRPARLIVGGGGSRNGTLMADIAAALPDVRVLTNEDLGFDGDAK